MKYVLACSTIRSFVWSTVAIGLFTALAHAKDVDESVAIHSASSLRPEFAKGAPVNIDIVLTNDGSHGPVYARLVIRSRDGLVHTSASTPTLPIGTRQKVALELKAPWTYFGRDTDDVFATVRSSGDQSILVTCSTPQHFTWGEHIAPAPTKPGVYHDWRNVSGYREALLRNFDDQTFTDLDSLLDRMHASGETGLDGDLHVHAYWDMIFAAYRYPSPKLWLQKWRADTGSLWSAMAMAAYEREIARRIVGGEDREVADPMAARLFRERVEKARSMLEAVRAQGQNNRIWHELRIWTEYDLQDNRALRAVFEDAINKFPTYRHYYLILARYWAPKSKPKNWDEVQKIIDLALEKTATVDGAGMYFYAYLNVLRHQTAEFDVFRNSPATWPRMRKALEDLLARNPDAASIKNYYAAYACRAGDEKTFSSAWWKLGTDEDLEYWPTNYSPELCKSRYLRPV